MKQEFLDMARQVLDHEVIDVNNIACGMVDDLELECEPGGEMKVTAILIGAGAWSYRLPRIFQVAAQAVFGKQKTRVPWEEVMLITERVKLRSRASELGLGKADRKAGKWIKALPGSSS